MIAPALTHLNEILHGKLLAKNVGKVDELANKLVINKSGVRYERIVRHRRRHTPIQHSFVEGPTRGFAADMVANCLRPILLNGNAVRNGLAARLNAELVGGVAK